MPPSGHVAGLISLLDRQRGAHYTPANATLADALDVTIGYSLAERGALNDAGINLLRCSPNQGIQVWGGRTLHPDASWRYVAHRRLIHRLVRAIRRVAEPLTFETNGPTLWLTFARAVTTVLVEAYRAGGLQGSRPEEAFRVTCDATNNPPEQIDLGQVVCDIQLAPAVPMEFITLRVVVSDQGALEVFES
jgi:phage tail sheath protein FI